VFDAFILCRMRHHISDVNQTGSRPRLIKIVINVLMHFLFFNIYSTGF
jgi:hypothetical protein